MLPLISTEDNMSVATVQSFMLPPVNNNFTGLPSASTKACIFVFLPPREVPISWLVSPPKAPFLRQQRVDVLSRLCCRGISLAYPHLRSGFQISSLLCLHLTILQTYRTRCSTTHTVPVNLAMALRCAPSIIYHSARFGYLLRASQVLLYAQVAENPSLVPTRYRWLRIVFAFLSSSSPQ